MSNPLIALLESTRRPRILVVGDVMLDRYVWCDASRISPEAPIPVVRMTRQDDRLGGAGNVGAMLAALEAEVAVAAVVGDDVEGRVVREELGRLGIDAAALIVDPQRSTSLKQRFLGRSQLRFPQQMLRVDREDAFPLAPRPVAELLSQAERRIAQCDLVLVSDYGKGVCEGALLPWLVDLARRQGVPVVADTVRGVDYRRYAGCACITPNRPAAAEAAGMPIVRTEDALCAARRLLELGPEAVAITLDRDGIAWADRHGNAEVFPVRAREVCDVTGAGDAVLSALGYAIALGADFRQAVALANLAGGLEVERLGVVPLGRRELLTELGQSGLTAAEKIVNLPQLLRHLQPLRQAGRRIVMTNGCFDLLHPGHVATLEAARKQGDCLIVGLNSDQSVRVLKGPDRPIVDEQGRAEMLAALACVDFVVLFDDASVAPLVEQLLPDVLVKSAEYAPAQIVGHEILERVGGRVVGVPVRGAYSTSQLIAKARRSV